MKLWCVECNADMDYEGIAHDHPDDGDLFICPKCGHRIVVFEKRK